MVTHQNRGIDGDRAGAGLGYGRQIQHFFLLNPVQFFHKALPHERDNDKPAAECTRAEFKGRKEQLPIFIFLVQ